MSGLNISKYRALFLTEAAKLLENIDRHLVSLEKQPGDSGLLEELFRFTHSMKGMSLAIGYRRIGEVAHAMEDLLDDLRQERMQVTAEVIDVCLQCQDTLRGLVDSIREGRTDDSDLSSLFERVQALRDGDPPPLQPLQARESTAPTEAPAPAASTPPPAANPSPAPAEAPVLRPSAGGELRLSNRIEVDTHFLDACIESVGELLMVTTFLRGVADELAGDVHQPKFEAGFGRLRKAIERLHHEVTDARMTPIASLSDLLPRLVRDVARREAKEVALEVEGAELRVDRTVLHIVSAPLLHLFTNAIVHGIESPADRSQAGKAQQGTVRLKAEPAGDRVRLTVSDDGRGMDPARIKAVAVSRGMVSPRRVARISDAEALELICLPGFTTTRGVSQAAGRGVGMESVRSAVEELGGLLRIYSEPGQGSRFELLLPLSLSIIGALVLETRGQPIAVPVSQVTSTAEVSASALRSRGDRIVAKVGEDELPVVSLGELLRFEGLSTNPDPMPLLLARDGNSTMAFVVDRFVGQQDVVAKPLSDPLRRIPGLGGITVLGDGRPTFILDMPRLVEIARAR